eukprot:1519312-Pyramimonas_sp.AAC.1
MPSLRHAAELLNNVRHVLNSMLQQPQRSRRTGARWFLMSQSTSCRHVVILYGFPSAHVRLRFV